MGGGEKIKLKLKKKKKITTKKKKKKENPPTGDTPVNSNLVLKSQVLKCIINYNTYYLIPDIL